MSKRINLSYYIDSQDGMPDHHQGLRLDLAIDVNEDGTVHQFYCDLFDLENGGAWTTPCIEANEDNSYHE